MGDPACDQGRALDWSDLSDDEIDAILNEVLADHVPAPFEDLLTIEEAFGGE